MERSGGQTCPGSGVLPPAVVTYGSLFRSHFCFQQPRRSLLASLLFQFARLTMAANVPGSPAATGHQPGSHAATCPPGSPAATCPPLVSDFWPPLVEPDLQPYDTDVHAPLRAAFEAEAAVVRARAVAACVAAVADLESRTRVTPQFIKDFGGYSAPVVVTGLQIADVFPATLRYTIPSVRRVAEELHHLVRALPGERARLLVKMCYWPKLLEAVVTQEKKDEQSERARLRRQSDKQFLNFAPGCFEPEDAATSPYEAVVATSPDVGGNEAVAATSPELRRMNRARLNGKQHTAGSASASSAAAASSAPSASCAAAAAGLASEDHE